jgi:hypothetical protein
MYLQINEHKKKQNTITLGFGQVVRKIYDSTGGVICSM